MESGRLTTLCQTYWELVGLAAFACRVFPRNWRILVVDLQLKQVVLFTQAKFEATHYINCRAKAKMCNHKNRFCNVQHAVKQ